MTDPSPTAAATDLAWPLSFTQSLSATRRGARLARLLCVMELRTWDVPHCLRERAELVIAELAANAVLHGSEPSDPRCDGFRVGVRYAPAAELLRIEVTDTGAGAIRPPERCSPPAPPAGPGAVNEVEFRHEPLLETGRGLELVTALADHWDTVPHQPRGKTVRAVLTMLWPVD